MMVGINMVHLNDFIKTTVTGLLNFTIRKQAHLDIASQIEQSESITSSISVRQKH